MNERKNERNNSIDIFRYVCALMVVIIHTNPFCTGSLAPLGVFLKQFFARVAVPYFFVVSGYFLFKKLDKDEKKGYLAAWSQIKTYFIWSIPYILINFVAVFGEGFSFISFAKDVVVRFFIYGQSSHFWFFPALIYGTVAVTFLYKRFGWKTVSIFSVVLYLIGLLGSTYLPIGTYIPILSKVFNLPNFYVIFVRPFMTGIPFLVLGGFVARNEEKLMFLLNYCSKEIIIVISCIVLFSFEKGLILLFGWSIDYPNTIMLYPLLTVIMLILLKHPLPFKTKLAQNARTCSNFIYYTHIAFMLVAERLFGALFGIQLSGILMFFITSAVLTLMGVALHHIKFARKLLN